jgi:hypothetical protein
LRFLFLRLAYTFVYTGMANSLAFGLSKIGLFFVVLAPVLGWIGVALSGSNTSTNAMFGPVQAMTGRLLHLPVPAAADFQFRRLGSGKADRAANGQRGRFHQQACAQRRPGDPPQHGLDAHSARLPDPDQHPLLLFVSQFDVAVDDGLQPVFFRWCENQNRQAEARPTDHPCTRMGFHDNFFLIIAKRVG